MFSHRVILSEPNAILKQQAQLGTKLVNINDANPTHHGLAPALLPQRYEAEAFGPLTARQALAAMIAQRDQHPVEASHICLTGSTSQGYAWLLKLLCDAGQAILAPRPGYPLIDSLARLEAVDVYHYQLNYDGSWYIDVAQIAQYLQNDTQHDIRALVVINPNNPTGSYVHSNEREELLNLCQKYNIALIADEVFFDYALQPFEGRQRFANNGKVLTFSLDGLSKSAASPHAKVGWIQISGPEAIVTESITRLSLIADDFLPISSALADQIPELLALIKPQEARVNTRIHENLRILTHRITDSNSVLSVLRIEGGWNVLLRFPSVIDEDALVLYLMRNYGLTGQPGYWFDMQYNGYLAVSLLPEPSVFNTYINVIIEAVEALL